MADTSQPTILNYASPTQFRITFNRIPTAVWFCTEANIPGISLGEAQFPTPMADMVLSGDKLTFDTLNMTFIVDEELVNYRELWDWLVGIGAPSLHSQYPTVLAKGQGITSYSTTPDADARQKATPSEGNVYSDAQMIIYDSKNIPKVNINFKDMFPTSISSLEYTQGATDVDYFKATVNFRYTYYHFETAT